MSDLLEMNDELVDRNYLILSVSEINKVNFDEVLETSTETIRKSVDGLKTFVKWNTETQPHFVSSLTTKEGPYSYEEIMFILATDDWAYKFTI